MKLEEIKSKVEAGQMSIHALRQELEVEHTRLRDMSASANTRAKVFKEGGDPDMSDFWRKRGWEYSVQIQELLDFKSRTCDRKL